MFIEIYKFHVGDCRGRKRPRNDKEAEIVRKVTEIGGKKRYCIKLCNIVAYAQYYAIRA